MLVRLSAAAAALAAILAAAVPAVAHAAPAGLPDHVVDAAAVHRLQARAAQAGDTLAVPTKEGYSVSVAFSAGVPVDPQLAGTYVAFLDGLPHGTELRKLNILIADTSEVASLCGGDESDGILACYGARGQQMIVPSSGLDTTTEDGGYSTAYVLTHEYGHHIAANRDNQGFAAIDYGPKYWASAEMVCDRTLGRKLAPGDEAGSYLRNPGEAWAEVYARLTFPDQPWTFTRLLRPDLAALDAARRDVLTPWSGNASKTFVMPAGRRTQSFDVPLTLDGRLSAVVRGRSGSDVKVAVTSGRQKVGHSDGRGGRNVWRLRSGCRERPTETLTFTVSRTAGRGPVTLLVSYPG
jgi:hypothetical protein